MGLTHEFFLIPNELILSNRIDWYYDNRSSWINKVEIEDHIILYLMDFINWVPTFNPETKVEGHGLNYYGVTFIYKEGAEKLLKILSIWEKLILEAPEIINFKGQTIWREEENGDTYWEETRDRITKTIYIKEIQKLIHLAIKVSENNGYIMHYGI